MDYKPKVKEALGPLGGDLPDEALAQLTDRMAAVFLDRPEPEPPSVDQVALVMLTGLLANPKASEEIGWAAATAWQMVPHYFIEREQARRNPPAAFTMGGENVETVLDAAIGGVDDDDGLHDDIPKKPG